MNIDKKSSLRLVKNNREHSKLNLQQKLESLKNVASVTMLGAATIGAFLIGYFLLPKKINRFAFKTLAMASIIKQISEMVQNENNSVQKSAKRFENKITEKS
jgi:hypothetical protein